MRIVNKAGIDLIKSFEKWKEKAYLDAVGILTIGWGHVVLKEESFTVITIEEGEELLAKDLSKAIKPVLRNISVPLTDNQFAALVSFTFNLGGASLQRSTLRRKINRGELEDIKEEFLKWNKAGGKKLAGLAKRRLREAELFAS
jgi:lysozyme